MRSKLVQNGDGQRHDSRIDGPDEEFGCSFFTRSRSKSSCTELRIDDNQATRLKPKKDPRAHPWLWHQSMYAQCGVKLVGMLPQWPFRCVILAVRVSVEICFFTDLVYSGAHWWWFSREKLLQIRLLPAVVLWLQKSEEAAAVEINHGHSTHTFSYIWATHSKTL